MILSPEAHRLLNVLRAHGSWVPVDELRREIGGRYLNRGAMRPSADLERLRLIRFGRLGSTEDDEPGRLHVRITDEGQRVLDPDFDPLALMGSLGVGARQ